VNPRKRLDIPITRREHVAGSVHREYFGSSHGPWTRDKLADLGATGQNAVNQIARGYAEGFAGSVIAHGIGSVFAWQILTYNPYTAAGSCVVGVGRRQL
jgi:hypothetical protein